jgi:hypothetical protein
MRNVICTVNQCLLVHSMYAYRIWIGICFLINEFIVTDVVNIVSKGRSRALPIIVVSLQSMFIPCHFILLMHHQYIIVILALGEFEPAVAL